MWAGPHTALLSGKSMLLDINDIDSADESTLCFTIYVNIHVVELSTLYVKIQHTDNIICGALCQNVCKFVICQKQKLKTLHNWDFGAILACLKFIYLY